MHLIFNYCLLHHHAQWENVKGGNLQYFKRRQSVGCDHHAHKQIGILTLNMNGIIFRLVYAQLIFMFLFAVKGIHHITLLLAGEKNKLQLDIITLNDNKGCQK